MLYKDLLTPDPLFAMLKSIAQETDIPLYVVGGFVRDRLLARTCKDIDILCLGDSAQVAHAFATAIGGAKVSIFKNFGTAMVPWQDFVIEFVTARKESYTPSSRKPVVSAGTLEEDIARRDFTINAMAIGIHGADAGRLVDLFGGLQDLKAKLLRTPLAPRRTFSDDPLRMLRCVRFAAQLGFSIAPTTMKAMQREVPRLSILSKERIIVELNKILLSPIPAKGFYLLDEAGLLSPILPEMEALKGRDVINGQSHKDNFHHTLKVLQNASDALANKEFSYKLWLLWAALLHDIAKPMTKRFDPAIGFTFHGHEIAGAKMVPKIFRRLGLPMRKEMRYVKKLVALHLRHIPLVEQEVTDSAVRRFLYDVGEELEDLLILCRADITSGNAKKVTKYLANFDKLASKIKAVREKDYVRTFTPVIDGQIIMDTFGLPPCREIGVLKNALKEAILAGEIPNEYAPVYAYMVAHAKQLGLSPLNHE